MIVNVYNGFAVANIAIIFHKCNSPQNDFQHSAIPWQRRGPLIDEQPAPQSSAITVKY